MARQYGAKKDANHRMLVQALEAGGCQVIDISAHGYGAPDLIVCRRGETLLVELKNPQTGYGRKLNKNQVAWATNWPAPVYILKSLADVTEFLNCRPVAVMVKK